MPREGMNFTCCFLRYPPASVSTTSLQHILIPDRSPKAKDLYNVHRLKRGQDGFDHFNGPTLAWPYSVLRRSGALSMSRRRTGASSNLDRSLEKRFGTFLRNLPQMFFGIVSRTSISYKKRYKGIEERVRCPIPQHQSVCIVTGTIIAAQARNDGLVRPCTLHH